MSDWDTLEARNAPLNAFVDFDRGATFGEGPLADLVIGVKSNIAVKGLPWTAGMGTRRHVVADRDAAVVARLREAGALIAGTLNMHEAALGATTDNAFYGRTHNPHRHGFTPGGSSGGSAAAVAAGLCDAALGTDTLGSVRIPAAYCGVWGLKPTLGAVSTDGLVHLGRDFDVIGPIAKDLATLERVWRALSAERRGTGAQRQGEVSHTHAPLPARSASGPSPLRREGEIVLAEFEELHSAVRAAYERALAALPGTRTLALPYSMAAVRRAALAQIGRELIADLGDARHGDDISSGLKSILNALEDVPLGPDVLIRTRATLVEALGTDGVLVMPTAPQPAFAHGERPPGNQADFTALASVAGLPALAVPAGTDSDGLPVGIQLVGPAHREDLLFDIARRLDANHP